MTIPSPVRLLATLSLCGLQSLVATASSPTASPAWKSSIALSMREAYDSNVFLQDHAPSASVVGAVPANRSSLVTSASLALGTEYRRASGTTFTGSYTPEIVRYHSASTENHVAHRAQLGLSGNNGNFAWNLTDSLVWIVGDEDSPIYGGPGGAPALGGVPVRDRRASLLNRSGYKLEWTHGAWLFRTVGSAYWQDFRTRQSRQAGCANYVDRSEAFVGVEAGYEFRAKTRWLAGFRSGRQDQGDLHGVGSPYDSTRRRFFTGVEGAPVGWLKLSLLAGLETRTFSQVTPSGFDRQKQLLWIDASATATPTKRDTLSATFRRAEQPASTSFSLYEDTTGEISWRHKCTERFSTTAALKICLANWQLPVLRRDRIYTPSLLLQYAATKRCQLEASWSCDSAVSAVPATEGREFTRHLCAGTVRYTF